MKKEGKSRMKSLHEKLRSKYRPKTWRLSERRRIERPTLCPL